MDLTYPPPRHAQYQLLCFEFLNLLLLCCSDCIGYYVPATWNQISKTLVEPSAPNKKTTMYLLGIDNASQHCAIIALLCQCHFRKFGPFGGNALMPTVALILQDKLSLSQCVHSLHIIVGVSVRFDAAFQRDE